jgi:predicted 3-demethylubiquinone-9 3-methyltransferase (glyoxalase superfamily)
MQKITPCFWFDGKAEEAMKFYLSVFKSGKVVDTMYYGDAGPGPRGSVLAVTFELEGQRFMGLNGGPHYTLSPAISMFVACETQAEVDHYWDKLLDGGKAMQCGWLTDKFGVSWQIVPAVLGKMLQDKDPARSKRVMEAMLEMVKLDIAGLQRAYDAA